MSTRNLGQTDAVTISFVKETDGARQVYDALDLSFTTRIHQDYEIIVTVCSDDTVQDAFKTERCFNVGEWYAVEIRFHEHNKLMYLQGVCTGWQATGQYANEYEIHQLTLKSELYPLFTNQRSGVYYGGSLKDVIQKGLIELCQKQNLTPHIHFENKLTQKPEIAYPAQLSLTQYLESDMAFILRQMREFGAWFNVYHPLTLPYNTEPNNLASQKITVTLGDDNSAFVRYHDALKVLHNAESQGDGFYEIKVNIGGTALGTVEGIFYDEITGKTLTTTAKIPAGQANRVLKYTLPQTVLTEDQMHYQTQVVADSLSLRQQCLSGNFQGLFIQAGNIIKIDDETFDLNGEYLLVEVSYQFSKIKDNQDALYQQTHSFKAHPLNLSYHPELVDADGQEPEIYRRPKYQGVMPGIFALTQGSYTVTPDALGSIPLWFPYNYWYTCQGQTCRYTRVISQANQGGKSGVSFPYYQDTEFVLMFVNGDLDRPVIKGTAANNLTGHLHNQSVQKRSALALPQGQHLVYSNVPGDQNFLKYGATHNEGSDETHMLLSNYPDVQMPGAKKLDYQQATTQSYERVTGNNFLHQAGGNQMIRTDDGKVPPKTYLLIQLCDQSNSAQTSNKPILTSYLSNVTADLIVTQSSGQVSKLSDQATDPTLNYACKILVANNPTDIANLKSVDVTLNHKNTENPQEAVNAISLNSKPILPNNILHLESADWQNNKTTDSDGNVYYTVYIVLLPPPLLFNFRQGFYAANKALPEDQQSLYQATQQFFSTETYEGNIQETLSADQLAFYQNQGQNILIFIHGFHVGFGQYPSNFIQTTDSNIQIQGNFTLYRTQNFIKNRYGNSNNPQLSQTDLLYGTGAHNWLITMEYNLNTAFGFDDQDYSKYTRILGVTWQGNPSDPVNYMAAVPMSEFAAQKTFALVQQLSKAGIKVELMAHSLGSAVLARTLDLCGQNGIKVQHAHLWQPAIPDNAFDAEANANYVPIMIPDPKGTEINLPADYNYPHARDGAEQITVMFSDQDTILGQVPKNSLSARIQAVEQQTKEDISNLAHTTLLQKAFLALDPIHYAEKTAAGLIFAAKDPVLWQTTQDPGAGWGFAIPAAIIQFMDARGIKVGGTHEGLLSIYHMANLFRYPLGYIFAGNEEDLVTYFNDWKTKFSEIAVTDATTGATTNAPIKASAYDQAAFLFTIHPHTMAFAVGIMNAYCVYKNSSTSQSLSDAESDDTQTKIRTNLSKIFAAGTEGLFSLHWEKITNDLDESCKQSILIITVLLTALLTVGAVPPGAMGYLGVPVANQFGNYGYIDQNDVLFDHVGMLYPSADMMNKIYVDNLKNGIANKRIDYFGKWRPA